MSENLSQDSQTDTQKQLDAQLPIDPMKLTPQERRDLIATYRQEIANAQQEMIDLTEQLQDIQLSFVKDTQTMMAKLQTMVNNVQQQEQIHQTQKDKQ